MTKKTLVMNMLVDANCFVNAHNVFTSDVTYIGGSELGWCPMGDKMSDFTIYSSVFSTYCSDYQQRKHQSFVLLSVWEGNPSERAVDSLHKGQVTWKAFPNHHIGTLSTTINQPGRIPTSVSCAEQVLAPDEVSIPLITDKLHVFDLLVISQLLQIT